MTNEIAKEEKESNLGLEIETLDAGEGGEKDKLNQTFGSSSHPIYTPD